MHTAQPASPLPLLLFVLVAFLPVNSVFGQFRNYELYGSVELSTDYRLNRYGERDQSAFGRTSALVNQRLTFPAGELFARSRLELDDQETLAHDLEEGYIRLLPSPSLTMALGRQRLNWGAGYTYSATDALHPQTAEADRDVGFDGISGSWFPTPDLSVTLALALQDAYEVSRQPGDVDAWRRLRYAGYLSSYLGNLQIDPSIVYEPDTILRPGVSTSFTVAGLLLSLEGAVEFHNRNIYPTGKNFTQPDLFEPYPISSGAAEYSFPVGDLTITTISEYLYNGLGYDKAEFDTLVSFVALTSTGTGPNVLEESGGEGEQPFSGFASQLGAGAPYDGAGYFGLLRRHYLFQTISFSYLESWSSDHSVLVNLEDWSVSVSHGVTLTTMERLDLGVDVRWAMGEKNKDEFALLPYTVQFSLHGTVHF